MQNISDVVEVFVEASIKYGLAQEEGNSNMMNKQSRIIIRLRKELKKNSESGLKQLKPLLAHENDYVKLTVASSLIPLIPKEAENTLKELAMKRGLLGFEAQMTLQEWKKGNLKF